jgi:hypothetical protein
MFNAKIAKLALSLCVFFSGSSALANDHPVQLNTGIGFAMNSGGNATFAFGAGANYFLNRHVGLGTFFDLYADDGITTQNDCDFPLPCSSTRYDKASLDVGGQLLFSTGVESEFELMASVGAGYLRVMGSETALTVPLGIGAYMVLSETASYEFGFGTFMTFHLTTLRESSFIWNWRVLSLELKF